MDRRGRLADHEQPVDAELGGEPADLLVAGPLVLAELGQVAEHRDASAAPARSPASARSAAAVEAGLALYESSMTVTPSARSKTSIRRVETSRSSPSAGAELGQRHARARGPPPRRRGVLPTWCRPVSASRTGARPVRGRPGCTTARPRSSSVTSTARTVGVGRLADEHHRGPGCGSPSRRTRGSSALSTASAVRRQRLDQLALGRGDRLDRAELADVRDADVEHHADPRRRDLGTGSAGGPSPRAPISSTRKRVSAVGLQHRVRQCPSSLLNEPGGATVGPEPRRAAGR